ncbi:DUF2865 domain-containing protein [Rhizobium sp. BK376]|uniref:DUF2865 domain-containing protein n=1 Tax=Rhizobium sp. BK376 TaxID=2512149 RepID=UPI00105115A6|nr:DUF2865 domain-containing protein [Rhizobium sp. BK376]TCR83973.1 uncharacterized protein DUF2865 [Rhizobium sp. BK376]
MLYIDRRNILVRGGIMERSRKFSLFFLLPLIAATPVAAQNQSVCDELHGRLANIPEVVSTSHSVRRYSNAIDEQTSAVRRLQAEMQDRGCHSGSGVIINGQDAAVCDQLETSLGRLQEDLQFLIERRDESQRAGGSDDVLRDQLETALRQNGCEDSAAANPDTIITNRPEVPATPEQQAMRTDTFIQPMDRSGGPQPGYDYYQAAPMNYPTGGPYGAGLQTVCVRTCDGGFFPLTTNASPVNFQHDAETCSRMCPGVPTELYFRYLPNQESSEMVSAATGAPYSAMPYAFAYRKRAPGEKSSCTCDMSAYYEEMQREKASIQPQSVQPQPVAPYSSITTITTAKPPSPQPQTATTAQPAPADRPYDPTARKIRQVGPQFLSTDEGKIDLKHPLAPGPQPEQ